MRDADSQRVLDALIGREPTENEWENVPYLAAFKRLTDPPTGRFTDAMTEHERAMMMLALTFLLLDGTFGMLGPKWDEAQMDRDLPTLLAMANELGAPMGHQFDPAVIESVQAFTAHRSKVREQAETS